MIGCTRIMGVASIIPQYKILFQIASEHVVPNIVSILQVMPHKVVTLYTEGSKSNAARLRQWVDEHPERFTDKRIVFCEIPVEVRDNDPSLYHSISQQFFQLLCDEISLAEKDGLAAPGMVMPVLNMTCGTKAMAMGAVDGASRYEKVHPYGEWGVPVVYLSPNAHAMELLSSCGSERHEWLRSRVFDKRKDWICDLSVEEIVAANKYKMQRIGPTPDWRECYKAAVVVQQVCPGFRLTEPQRQERRQMGEYYSAPLCNFIEEDTPDENSPYVYSKADQHEAYRQIVNFAIAKPPLRESFFRAGLEVRDNHLFVRRDLLEPFSQELSVEHLKAAVRGVQRAATFIVSGWWEVLVAAWLYRDLRRQNVSKSEVLWSVETVLAAVSGNEYNSFVSPADPAETDVIASDGHVLSCVSCKRGMNNTKELMREISSHSIRSQMLGGILGDRYLAVYDSRTDKVKEFAAALGLRLLNGEDICRELEHTFNPIRYVRRKDGASSSKGTRTDE